MAGIRVANLVHAYRDGGREVRAVDDISFEVAENQFYTLLGPSGCGKTTTLRCVAGLEDPTSGEIDLDGVAVVSARGVVPTHRRPIGMVFQDYAVWPHMTVFQNVAFPLRVAGGTSRAEVRERVAEALALVGMEAYTQRRATQLSGGQQQRISLARALVRRPKVLLLDEPLSNLDAKLREQMRAELRSIQRLLRVTTIFVTHDQVEALAMSNRIAVMSAGRIIQEGTPREIYLEPNSRFVASFVGATTFVEGRVESSDAQGTANLSTPLGMLRCAVHEPPRAGTDVTVAIRPESIRLTDEEVTGVNVFAGEIELALFNGESVDYRVRVESETIRVTGGGRTNYRRGDRVSLVAPPEECVIIADEGGASTVGGVATSDNASR